MAQRSKEFGSFIRREREGLKIGLREMARRIGVSPTYLSMVERGQVPPPAEDKVKAIADILGSKRDELLALAGKISSDVEGLIIDTPEFAGLVRKVVAKASAQISISNIIQKALLSIEETSQPEAAPTGMSKGKQPSSKNAPPRRAERVENPERLRRNLRRGKESSS